MTTKSDINIRTQEYQYKNFMYCKTFNIKHTLGNKIVDHSDVVGASPVGTAPSNYIFILDINTWLQWIGQRQLQDEMRSI